jgi:DNA-directed RNA polymerase specialized sigma24 family protein
MTTEAFEKLDAAFAARIAARDRNVVAEIERAYADPLRRQLCRFRGPALNDHDIEDVLSQTIEETWNSFTPTHGTSLRSFYFHVGKRRLQDRLRANLRRLNRLDRHGPAILRLMQETSPAADQAAMDREVHSTNGQIVRLIERAVTNLTKRQHLAFNRRFATGGGAHWAKQLEQETGIPAKQWRKASDEARTNIRTYLIRHGVRYSEEGGCYEVA